MGVAFILNHSQYSIDSVLSFCYLFCVLSFCCLFCIACDVLYCI